MIDAWMPTPDRDSASLRMVNLVSILEKMAGKVTFGVGDPPAWRTTDTWQPSTQPLQETRVELLEGQHATIETHLKRQGRRYDVVILSRLSVAGRYMEVVRQAALTPAHGELPCRFGRGPHDIASGFKRFGTRQEFTALCTKTLCAANP